LPLPSTLIAVGWLHWEPPINDCTTIEQFPLKQPALGEMKDADTEAIDAAWHALSRWYHIPPFDCGLPASSIVLTGPV
jgi:hypothetical protein